MAQIEMYTTPWCGYCVRAKKFLDGKGLPYEEILVDENTDFRAQLFDLTGSWTVPQILIDSKPIGGYTELRALDRDGLLDELVKAA
jgi:glutaredoxin 3